MRNNHGYEPQGKPCTLIPPQGAGYYTLRLWRDCSTCKFQYTSFLKFESHNKLHLITLESLSFSISAQLMEMETKMEMSFR